MLNLKLITASLLILSASCARDRSGGPSGHLVSTSWLQEHLDDPGLRIFHLGDRDVFDREHIPGSQFIAVRDYLAGTDSVSNELPPLAEIQEKLREMGVSEGTRIVLSYEDDFYIRATSRMFLTLAWAGLADRVYFLDGGMQQWLKEDRETSSEQEPVSAGDVVLSEARDFIISARELDNYRQSADYLVVDGRPPRQYLGTYDDLTEGYSGGHISGAVNHPWEHYLNDTIPWLFKPETEVRSELKALGMDRDKKIIYYCNSGIQACVCFMYGMHLGYDVLFYDGSMQDWEQLEMPVIQPVPKELAAGPGAN